MVLVKVVQAIVHEDRGLHADIAGQGEGAGCLVDASRVIIVTDGDFTDL